MQRIEAMKWMQRLALLVVMVWSGLFGTPLRAQETAGPSAPKPMVWTGYPPISSPQLDSNDSAKLAEALEKELAGLKVALDVDGATEAQRKELARLWVIATRREEFPRRWEVLKRIAVARAEELERRGELAAALRAVTDLLPQPGLAGEGELTRLGTKFEFSPATVELEKAAKAEAKDPKLVELRARLEKKLAQQKGLAHLGEGAGNAAKQDQDENAAALLEDAVMRALLEQQPGMIRDLGARAAPALEQLVANDLDTLPPDASLDPLVLLFEVDEARGAQFALQNWPKGGYLFHKRVLRAMERANVLRNPGTWRIVKGLSQEFLETPPQLVDTLWRDVLLLALEDTEVVRDSLEPLRRLAELDALDGPLQQACVRRITNGPQELAVALMELVRDLPRRETLVPIAESALAGKDGELRVLAAEFLESMPRNAALRACTSDPELGVRMAVARSLSTFTIVVQYAAGAFGPGTAGASVSSGVSEGHRRSIDARDSACVEGLLADADPAVRTTALEVFRRSTSVTVSTPRLVALATDGDAGVRRRLADWRRSEAMPVEVLQLLASDTDSDVVGWAARELRRIAGGMQASDGTTEDLWDERYLPVLEALLANPLRTSVDVQAIAARIGSSPESARFVVRLARTKPEDRSYGLLATVIAVQREKLAWDAIGVDELPVLLREGHALLQRSSWIELFSELPERHAAAFRALLLDAKAAPEVRALAAAASAATADAEWNRAFADVVESLPEAYLSTDDAAECRMIHAKLRSSDRLETLLMEIAGRPGAPDTLGVAFRELARGETCRLPEPLALQVLRREAARPGGAWSYVQWQALASLNYTEAEPRLEILERFIGDRWLWGSVINEISRHHLDAHLPLLERAALGEFDEEGNILSYSVAQILAGYLDDRAAEILLKAIAATSDQSRREALFKALDEIRRYQDERERWANRKSSKAARDAAIAELVPMLADKDATIRAQAARSLGALEALEQLPALVRLLKDSDGNVRKAAQSAIDVLTAPKPVPPAPEAPKSGAPAKKDE